MAKSDVVAVPPTERPSVPGGRADDAYMRDLYDRFGSRLFAFALKLTRDRQWADDIVQVTLIRAWRARGTPTESRSTGTWLYTVAHHVFIDDCRARSARPTYVPDDGMPAPVAEDGIDRLICNLTVAGALAAVPADQREAIIQVHYLQHTVAEAAEILGVPPGTVKSRIYYGLRAARARLLAAQGRPRLTLVKPISVAPRPGSRQSSAVEPPSGPSNSSTDRACRSDLASR